jgi:hypothetical protein
LSNPLIEFILFFSFSFSLKIGDFLLFFEKKEEGARNKKENQENQKKR